MEYIDTRSRFVQAVKAALMANDVDSSPQKTEPSGQIGTAGVDTDNALTEREQN